MVSPTQMEEYWRKTRGLLVVTLVLWFIFGYVVHAFALQLNEITFLGFPLGFYMGAQGSLIAFVLIIFWYAHRQNQIDQEFGVAED